MKWLILLFFPILGYSSPVSDRIIFYHLLDLEGYRRNPYLDRGHYSIGIGHNLSAHHQVVRKYSTVEINRFFTYDLITARHAARVGVQNFDNLPQNIQLEIIGLIWTVGPSGWMKFVKFRSKLENEDYLGASFEIINSKWATQIPWRAKRLIDALQSA